MYTCFSLSPGVGDFEGLMCSTAIKYTPAHRGATMVQILQRHFDVDRCVSVTTSRNDIDNAGLDKSTTVAQHSNLTVPSL
jgi:hypothetical protein